MAGQLQSAIVEIRNVHDLFMSLRNVNPNHSPARVIECLEKFFGGGNRHRSMFTNGDETQIKFMEKLQTVYQVYQKLAVLCPDSAPNTLIEAMDAILKSSKLAKFETENWNGDNNDDDDSPSVFDGALVRKEEEVSEILPSTSTSSLQNQRQQRVKNWVDTHSIPSPTCSSNQDEINDVENTTNSENVQVNADEIVSNGGSSFASGVSVPFNSNEQQNDNGIQVSPENKKVYECRYGCGKTFGTMSGRWRHEKYHSGIGLANCDYCGQQFSSRPNCARHQRTCRVLPPVVRQQRRQRIPFPFRCDFCFTRFVDLEKLEKHRNNNPEKSLKKCRFPPCTRGFCYESRRLQHEKSHSKL